jgi:predicted Rossmann-fold nucleotide-binding protein
MNIKYKIGIFGSAIGNQDLFQNLVEKAVTKLVKNNCIIVNGATTGVSMIATQTAVKLGGEVWGFSAATNAKKHLEWTPGDKIENYAKLIYVPGDYLFKDSQKVCWKYRNVTSTATCDAGIIISGRWGTMNEFTNLYDMEKVIGVIQGSGGVADELPLLLQKINKKSQAEVIWENNPEVLVDKVLVALAKRKS